MYVCDGGEWEGDLEEECVEGGMGGGGAGCCSGSGRSATEQKEGRCPYMSKRL